MVALEKYLWMYKSLVNHCECPCHEGKKSDLCEDKDSCKCPCHEDECCKDKH